MGTSGATAGGAGGSLDILTFVEGSQTIGSAPINVSEVALTLNFTVPSEYTSYDILATASVGIQDISMAADSTNEIGASLYLDGSIMGVSGASSGYMGINQGDSRSSIHVTASELGESATGARTIELKFVTAQADGNRWIYPQIIATIIPRV